MSEQHPDNLPTLNEALNGLDEVTEAVAIPILNEVINTEELQRSLLDSLELPDDLREELAQRITKMVEHRLGEILPGIMREIELAVVATIMSHIHDTLPSLLSDALKSEKNQ